MCILLGFWSYLRDSETFIDIEEKVKEQGESKIC